MDNTFYVRNWRPNAVVFKYAGLKYVLERRGDRKDSVALPIDAKSDPVVNRWLRTNILEEVSREDFSELASRIVDGPFGALRGSAKDVNIPMNANSDPLTPTPYTIDTTLLNNEAWKNDNLSPKLDFVEPPLTTEQEVAKNKPVEAPKPKGRPRKTV